MRKWLKQDSPVLRSRAEKAFNRYVGCEVVVFYEDLNKTTRKMIGTILAIEDDIIHLESEKTGWRASVDTSVDTSVCKVQSICTTAGWGKLETNNEL